MTVLFVQAIVCSYTRQNVFYGEEKDSDNDLIEENRMNENKTAIQIINMAFLRCILQKNGL